ncbi:MAG: hypothetical protein JO331_10610 [Verrucomicrobia bacterium]|nr:hypothetical protein [Verrucomicrobiota bacterium]
MHDLHQIVREVNLDLCDDDMELEVFGFRHEPRFWNHAGAAAVEEFGSCFLGKFNLARRHFDRRKGITAYSEQSKRVGDRSLIETEKGLTAAML